MEDAKEHFDPSLPSALCYTPLSREQLEEKLKPLGLCPAPGCCGLKRGFFSPQLLDELYSTMERWRSHRGFIEQKESNTQLMAAIKTNYQAGM